MPRTQGDLGGGGWSRLTGSARAGASVSGRQTLVRGYEWGLPVWVCLSCFVEPLFKTVTTFQSGAMPQVDVNYQGTAPWQLRAVLYLPLLWAFAGVTTGFAARLPSRLPRRHLLRFVALCATVGVVVALHPTDLHYLISPSALISAMAPGTIMTAGLFFLGATPSAWQALKKGIIASMFVAAFFVLKGMLEMGTASRAEAYLWLLGPVTMLLPGCLLTLPAAQRWPLWGKAAALAPSVAAGLAGIALQSRLVLLVLLCQLSCYIYLRLKGPRVRFAEALWIAVAVVAVVSFVARNELASVSLASLMDRLGADTRTGQVLDFIEQANIHDCLIGIGYVGYGASDVEGIGHVDIGYVMISLIGGLPMTLSFILLLVVPAAKALRLRLEAEDAAVVAGATGYAVMLTSSAIPYFHVPFVIFSLLVGRCAYLGAVATGSAPPEWWGDGVPAVRDRRLAASVHTERGRSRDCG